jgi:hypothetical protein
MKTKSTPNQIKEKLGLHGVSDPAPAKALMAADKTISWRARSFSGRRAWRSVRLD